MQHCTEQGGEITLLQTKRLVLRRLSGEGLTPFRAYRGDPEVAKFQGWKSMDEEEAIGFLTDMEATSLLEAGAWTQLGIAVREGNALIGDVGVHIADNESEAELGITLAAGAQGQSIGFDAVEMVCAWLFVQTKIARIVAITHADNKHALALLERTPFQHTHDTIDEIDGTLTPERWFKRRRC